MRESAGLDHRGRDRLDRPRSTDWLQLKGLTHQPRLTAFFIGSRASQQDQCGLLLGQETQESR